MLLFSFRRGPRAARASLPLLLATTLLLSACSKHAEVAPVPTTEPAAAVQAQAARLAANDLVAYAHGLVTDEQYRQLGVAWSEGRSRWPLSELPLAKDLPSLLQTLSEPGAEQHLQQVFDVQLAGQAGNIRQSARALGLFGVQYLRNERSYTPEQRAHYVQLVTALASWAGKAPLADRARAKAAITRLVTAARATGLPADDAGLSAVGMESTLRKLGPFLAVFKSVAASYELPLDETLAGYTAELVSQNGDQAVVRVQYPLAAEQIDTTIALVRLQNHWYPRSTQDEVARLLQPPAAPASPPVPVTPGAGADVANAKTPAGR